MNQPKNDNQQHQQQRRSNRNYGKKKVEEDVVYFILDSFENHPNVTETKRYELCEEELRVGRHTVRRIWKHHQDYGEFPYETKAALSKLSMKGGGRVYSKMKQKHRDMLKEICEDHPGYYLDEFANELFRRSGYVFHISTICRAMKSMNYSLQVCYHI